MSDDRLAAMRITREDAYRIQAKQIRVKIRKHLQLALHWIDKYRELKE